MDHECDNCYGTGFIGDGISAKACHCSPHLFSNNQPSPNLNAARTEIARLAAENSELRKEIVYWKKSCIGHATNLAAANATLDKLRDAVHPDERRSWSALDEVHAILYPKPTETPDE